MVFRWPWFRSVPKSPLLKANEQFFKRFSQDKPIDSYEFVSFDTELTGFNPRKDQIVSIGAVRIKDLRIVAGDNFLAYVNPTRDLPKDSTLVHRITPEQVENAPLLEEVLPDFVEFCGTALLIGHFVVLDMQFMNRALRRHMGGIMENPCVDSMTLARVFEERKRQKGRSAGNHRVSYNLGHLARGYDLPLFDQHDALEDALQTAYLFLYLVKKLKEFGYITLKDLFLAGKMGPGIF